MKTAALYARYSSDQQNKVSIEDQLRICQELADREGWKVSGVYNDAAISGSTLILRPGIQSLLNDALSGKFDIIVAEALDRVSRDQADVATLYKQLEFAGVKLVTLAEGEISELHVGLKRTMNALFLKDLAKKTHRGMRGRAEKGKSAGGNCYGYDVVKRISSEGELIRGERSINEAEALVVRRIYREFGNGKSPRAIVDDLNKEGIPGPQGKLWIDTTLRGHRDRGTGILNNELYVGVLLWNRQRFIKNPTTGRRVARPNPEGDWIRTEVAELRIVEDALRRAVRARQSELDLKYEATKVGGHAARARALHGLRRPAFLFSGLIQCGVCGGTYGIVTNDRYGCTNRYRRGTCDNPRTVHKRTLEQRALAGITQKLMAPKAVRAAIAAYAEHIEIFNREKRARGDLNRRALEKVEKGITGILAAIEDGMYHPTVQARLGELERRREKIIAASHEPVEPLVKIQIDVEAVYRSKVERLYASLDDNDLRLEVSDHIRSMVSGIIMNPGERRGELHGELRGDLSGVLHFFQNESWPPGRGVITPTAVGPRNHRYRTRYAALRGGVVVCGKCHQIPDLRNDLGFCAFRPVRIDRHTLDERRENGRSFRPDTVVVERSPQAAILF